MASTYSFVFDRRYTVALFGFRVTPERASLTVDDRDCGCGLGC